MRIEARRLRRFTQTSLIKLAKLFKFQHYELLKFLHSWPTLKARKLQTSCKNAFFYFPLKVFMVFSNPAVPKDLIISEATSRRSGSFVFSSSSHSPST